MGGAFTVHQALMARLGLDKSGFSRGLRAAQGEADQASRRMRASFRGVALAAATIAAAVAGGTQALGAMAERGTQVTNVSRAFARVAGDQQVALAALTGTTRGLVTQYELMTQANTALTLGSARSVEQFGEMARVAQQLGRALGLDATFALNSLNIGIARQSRLVLDNLGLMVDTAEANAAYARTLNIQASALTAAQQKEAFRIAAMEQAREKVEALGGSVKTAGDSWAQLKVEIRDTIDALNTGVSGSTRSMALFDEIRTLLALARGRDPTVQATKDSLANLPLRALRSRQQDFAAMVTNTTRGRALAAQEGLTQDQALEVLRFINQRATALRDEARAAQEAARAEAELARIQAVMATQLTGPRLGAQLAPDIIAGRPGPGQSFVPQMPNGFTLPEVGRVGFGPGRGQRLAGLQRTESFRAAASEAARLQSSVQQIANTVEHQLARGLTNAVLRFESMASLVKDIGRTLLGSVIGSLASFGAGKLVGALFPGAAVATTAVGAIGAATGYDTGGTMRLRIDASSIPEPVDYGMIGTKAQAQRMVIEILRHARANGADV